MDAMDRLSKSVEFSAGNYKKTGDGGEIEGKPSGKP